MGGGDKYWVNIWQPDDPTDDNEGADGDQNVFVNFPDGSTMLADPNWLEFGGKDDHKKDHGAMAEGKNGLIEDQESITEQYCIHPSATSIP